MQLELSTKIKMLVSDFDGVFTDGCVYFSESGEVQKKLNFKDIMGISLLLKNGFQFGIISGEKSNIFDYFKNNFNITEIHGGVRQKGIVLEDLMKRLNLSSDEVVYIGDDINDIPAFSLVDYRIAPKNLNPCLPYQVQNLQITENFGGSGAIREVADKLLELKAKEAQN